MARFNLISNISNGVGLQRDFELLQSLIRSKGHQAQGVQFNSYHAAGPADINIFIETVVPALFQLASVNWLIPNPEWFDPNWVQYANRFHKILCKTQDGMRIFRQIGMLPEFIGWESRDFYDPSIPRERKFIHVAGNSAYKNTLAIMYAWSSGKMQVPVTIISEVHAHSMPIPNVQFLKRVSDHDLINLLNSHIFHLCPSHYEGWGHALHESLGVGAVVLTTDKPPMNENLSTVRVGGTASNKQCMAETWTVSGQELLAGALNMQGMPDEDIRIMSEAARLQFVAESNFFRTQLDRILAEVPV